MIEDLPKSLEIDVSLFINRAIIQKAPFFKNAGEIFIREVIQHLQPTVFLPNDYIIRRGEHGDCMYFLSKGDAEVLVGDKQVATLRSGSPFGEMALVQNEKRMASVRAIGYCDVYRLLRDDFDALRKKYPEFDAQVQQVIVGRMKETQARMPTSDDASAGKDAS
jgi:voltage-gated potassium channel